MRYIRLSLGLDPEMIERVDALRGDVPRERYLRRVIEDHVGGVPRPYDPPGAVGETVKRAKDLARVPEPKPSKTPPPKEQPVRTEQTSAASQGHTFVPAVSGSMRCKCGKPMGAH